ncbi:WAP four-disulfide core domain protein 2 [Bombina bombina]|uniref:WAP four-disulfide core domain protein 2 n=1 Tax=Bombina bombina TaxID=8345 RepID=UPI00235AE24E|nr:WAP four-disulfide core domain protein 2 [Bombina bombina]
MLALLFLLISFCSLQISRTEKAGVCPPPRYYIPNDLSDGDTWCKTDENCEGDKKCCEHAKGLICKTPAADRPGQCPECSKSGTQCPDSCTSDSECAQGLKCCFNECGLTCVPPPGETPGFCPAPTSPFIGICFMPCESCPEGQKCCPYNCRDECVTTVTEKEGTCPDAIVCIRGSYTTCDGDASCPEGEKCCSYKCGRACVSAV